MLRSDRGAAFTSEVVAGVNSFLGVQQAFGSAYHPEAQGYIEGRHQPVNRILASYCKQFPRVWVRWMRLAQWAMRATPRADRGGKSPYEIVMGMVPQGPLASLFEKVNSTRVADIGGYVDQLRQSLNAVHTHTLRRSLQQNTRKHRWRMKR